ncbi:hypothetical protein [Lacinutrix jangbogonensis]|uniref:hypothetical protein n=1 Tax=Lacinutrix jangbogonensis TaxID=1469557 RepID=UPI00053D360D|nr:hypothetical protein [Lacinutrix jangbogonensis]
MDYKYLGIIEQYNFNGLSNDEQDDYMFGKRYLLRRATINEDLVPNENEVGAFSVSGNISLSGKTYILSREIAEEFYQFLLQHYQGGLEGDNILFFKKFNEDTFALTDKKAKKLGLKKFNKIFKGACPEGDTIKGMDNETGALIFHNKFFTLNRERVQLTEWLRKERALFIQYLLGNKTFFDRSLFKQQPTLIKMFKFENDLLTLIQLNRKFNFIIDEHFSVKPISYKIYDNYSCHFEKQIQVDFICIQLKLKTNFVFVVSLFYFFRDKLSMKMPSAKLFQAIINECFNLELQTLKLTDTTNAKHKERLNIFEKKWNKFISDVK